MCWDKVIKLFKISTVDDKMGDPKLIGHYINDIEIIRIGILKEGSIFLVDKNGNFKLLNMKKFIIGKPQIDKDFSTLIISKDNNQCEFQKTMKFDGIISRQMILNSNKNELIILTNKKIYNPKIFNYQNYFNKYIKNEEKWMELLVFGINMYHGRMLVLEDISLNISERKKVKRQFLKNFTSIFSDVDTFQQNYENMKIKNKERNNKINNLLNHKKSIDLDIIKRQIELNKNSNDNNINIKNKFYDNNNNNNESEIYMINNDDLCIEKERNLNDELGKYYKNKENKNYLLNTIFKNNNNNN
jgi:hypothetical protein